MNEWWCYTCGVARNVAMCPVCGQKAPAAFEPEPVHFQNESVDQIAEDVAESKATLKHILSALRSASGSGLWSLFWFIVIIFLFASWRGSSLDRWTDKAWYSFRYNADFANITILKRPVDCDFFHAPLGLKGCTYEKRTNVFGDEQRQALIRQATTGEGRLSATNRPNAVTVYWDKTED